MKDTVTKTHRHRLLKCSFSVEYTRERSGPIFCKNKEKNEELVYVWKN